MTAPAFNEGFVERLHVFGTQSYESAYLADVMKFGIRVDESLLQPDGSGSGPCIFIKDGGAFEFKREPDPLPPPARVGESVRSPVTIATGGHQPVHPVHTPQMVPPLSSIPQPASQVSQPAAEPVTKLTGALRRFKLYTITNVQAEVLLLGAERFTMAVELDALESFAGWPDQWRSVMRKVVDEDGEAVTFYLCVDTGGGSDSWTFCEIAWADIEKLGVGLPNDANTYERKNKIPMPPRNELEDETQWAELVYGLVETEERKKLYQTLVNVIPAKRTNVPTTLVWDFALGVVIGMSGTGLAYNGDGILGLGRSDNISTGYKASVRRNSESFHAALVSRRIISRPIFYISIGHALYETIDSYSHYISFGTHINPSGNVDKKDFIDIDVLGEERTGFRGKWTVFLNEIIIDYADRSKKRTRIPIDAPVIVDSGATQSYLPPLAVKDIMSAMKELGASDLGWCGNLHRNDDVIFVFGRTKVRAEARMFFASPLSPMGAGNRIPLAVRQTSGSAYLLGVNFFRAFIVGFDEFDKPCIWLRAKASTRG